MDPKDEQALLYLAGQALPALLGEDCGFKVPNMAAAGQLAASAARWTLYYLKNPNAPRPDAGNGTS